MNQLYELQNTFDIDLCPVLYNAGRIIYLEIIWFSQFVKSNQVKAILFISPDTTNHSVPQGALQSTQHTRPYILRSTI